MIDIIAGLQYLTRPEFIFQSIIITILVLLVPLVNAFRYKIMLSNAGLRLPLPGSYMTQMAAKFSTYIIPFKAGIVFTKPIATRILSKPGIPVKRSTPIILFEQIFDLGWQIILLPFLIIFLGEQKLYNDLFVEGFLALIMIALVIGAFRYRHSLFNSFWRLKRFAPKKIKKTGKKHGFTDRKLRDIMEQSVRKLSDWRLLLKILIPTILVILIEPLILQFSVLAFPAYISFKTAFLVHWTSMIIGRISGMPGGFITRDVTVLGLLTFFAIPPTLALEITIFYRIITMLPSLIVGGVAFSYLSGKAARMGLR